MLSRRLPQQAPIISMLLLGSLALVLVIVALGVIPAPTQAHSQIKFSDHPLAYNLKVETPQGHALAAIGQQQVEEPTVTPTATATATPPRTANTICDGINTDFDLAITQRADKTAVFSGESVTYTVVIANCGTLASKSFLLKHTIPAQLLAVGWTFEHTGVVQISRTDWAIPNLNSKEVTTATLTGLLVSAQSCLIKNKIEVTSELAFDANKTNNVAEAAVSVVGTQPCTQYAYLPSIVKQPSPTPTDTPTATATATATTTPSTPTVTPTATGARVLYKEDFNSTSNKKWYSGSTDSGFCNSVYRDAAYDIEAKKGQSSSDGKTTCWRAAPSQAESLQLVYGHVEAKIYHREGKSDAIYGVYMNGKGGNELYLFRIWPNTSERTDSTKRCSTGGDWEFDRVKGGVSKALGSGRCHPAIRAGTGSEASNVLRIVHKRNGKLSIYINGTIIDSFTDSDQLTAGYGTGIYVRTDTTKDITIRFDDFTLYEELN